MPAYSAAWSPVPDLADLVRTQDGVVARAQLHLLGVTRQRIRDQVRARRWRPVGRHVIVLHSGPLTPLQRCWVAVVNAGPRAALYGLTAAALDGLTGFPTTDVHVVVPRGTRVSPLPGVIVHESSRHDVHPARRPPRTRLPRSLVDAATASADPVRACAILAAAVQQRLVTVAKLRLELAAVPAVRHRRLLLVVLGDIEGGAQSFAEIDAARLCRAAGLPPPSRQAPRTDGDGRRRYLDLFWDDYGVCVEIDGRFHMRERDWRLDMDRQNEIVAGGLRMLRFPTLTLRLEPARFVDQLARALARSAS